jgi:hypothetical protein
VSHGDQLGVVFEGERPIGPAEALGERGVEVSVGDAPDVVLPEDGRVQLITST